ncbi:MAG: hypothetical protein R3249_08470 [Nitriliruptorales bacterium]|nr:hypothetical protein [Nitriliruptorales bacterium]
MTTVTAALLDALVVATEGVEGLPGSHIASKLAVPLGIVFFIGSVYLLLWSNFGAKKGALIYLSAMGGFNVMLGVFWIFGAPGTPIATGPQNFPGQAADAYVAKWFPMEPGSERAQQFPKTNSIDNFVDLPTYIGNPDATEEDLEAPGPAALRGDIEQSAQVMLELYAPTESGALVLGGQRRAAWTQAAGDPEPGETRADPFFTVELVETRLTDDEGVRVAAALFQPYANFVDADGEVRQVPVTAQPDVMYAFKDPGAIQFPSIVWTLVSLLLFVVSLFGLDRMEQREKREQAEVAQPEDLATPVLQ